MHFVNQVKKKGVLMGGVEQGPAPIDIQPSSEQNEIEGRPEGNMTELQMKGHEQLKAIRMNDHEKMQAWKDSSRNSEALQRYNGLVVEERHLEKELSETQAAMGVREYFNFMVTWCFPGQRVEDPELSRKIAGKVEGLRSKSRRVLDQAEEVSQDPEQRNLADKLTNRSLALEFEARHIEARMIAENNLNNNSIS